MRCVFHVFVPTFEENGIFILGVVFLFGKFSPIETIVFGNLFFHPIFSPVFLRSNVKEIVYFRFFFVKFWGFEKCEISHILD